MILSFDKILLVEISRQYQNNCRPNYAEKITVDTSYRYSLHLLWEKVDIVNFSLESSAKINIDSSTVAATPY